SLPLLPTFSFTSLAPPRDLHSFPTRRSSDLEGEKVQADWLFNFVKAPVPIRPWLQVRMPTFGLADEEANTVVGYFEALDRVQVRSEEHTSELQSRGHLVCRLLLEKKKNKQRR